MKDYEFKNLQNAEHYGYDAQSNQLMEECAELIQAVNKHKRAVLYGQRTFSMEDVENIAEEIADVEVMLQQVKHLLRLDPTYIEHIKKEKILRTTRKIRSRCRKQKNCYT